MNKQHITIGLLLTAVLALPVFAADIDSMIEEKLQEEVTKNSKINKLNRQIEDRSSEVAELEEKLEAYERNIRQKQQEKATLQSHLYVIDESIAQTADEIAKTDLEREIIEQEIESIQEQIRLTEENIKDNKGQLEDLILQIDTFDRKTPLQITFENNTFSDFFSDVQFTANLQEGISDALSSLGNQKEVLIDKRSENKEKQQELAQTQLDLDYRKGELESEREYKQQLETEVAESEEKFQELLAKAKAEAAQIEGEIAALEQQAQSRIDEIRAEIQKKLEEGQTKDDLTDEEQQILEGTGDMIWPLTGTITCEFHCAGYPFTSYIGPHSGIDIGVSSGTQVKAAASGYVTRAKFDGTSNLAWVMIVHGDGLATVYMHLSSVDVAVDQYVFQGQSIGLSGGLPGTPGAGLSTGAHLHFEVRVDGIAVNPRNYL